MRTNIFLISIICCLSLQTNAQTFNNTIVNDNSSWAILSVGVCPYCPVWTQYVYFDGDSIVAGNSYKKVFSCDDKLHENIKYEGLMREQNKKTYFIPAIQQYEQPNPPAPETEYLLYDFSLEDDESFEYQYFESTKSRLLQVNKVDFIEINGVLKKRLQIGDYSPLGNDDYIVDTWVEGIGSLSGILNSCYKGIIVGAQFNLLCYYQNNELAYKNPAYSECYYDKREDLNGVQTIAMDDYNVYLNPVDDILTVSCLNGTISRIEIFDALGRQVYSQTYTAPVDVSSFSKGVYLLKVYDTHEQISGFKIMKK